MMDAYIENNPYKQSHFKKSESFRTLLTEQGIAARLGVSVTTVARYRKKGEIGYTMVGRRIRYTPQHLEDYLVRNEITPCAAPLNRQVSTSSANAEGRTTGARAGMIASRDRQSAHRSALAILGKPKSR
ncbi:hypothetical protein CFR73_09570 [Novacetimonas maltaceti]|uniref:helix-turn-helix domain-containing protein n=1 Tax=Novacetimonas maltaceti TaxID=1203393 RepID=UPI000D725137|nr:hypothetical protein CFR73_09570 [Novacetimonas maltaceti]